MSRGPRVRVMPRPEMPGRLGARPRSAIMRARMSCQERPDMNEKDEIASTPPDVGAMLEALRAEVRARRLAQGGAEPGPAERELARALDEIELYRVVSAHWPLLGRTLPERAINLVNKLVRRYLRWYI